MISTPGRANHEGHEEHEVPGPVLRNSGISRGAVILLVGIVVAAALLIWLVPAEQNLGDRVKIVYVHLALIWAGMIGLALAGLLGLGVLATGDRRLHSWLQTTGLVGVGFYAAGVLVSLLAMQVAWGAVVWAEPRTMAALKALAVAIIAQVVGSWLPWDRARGLLSLGVLGFVAWSTVSVPLVMHPRDPIRSSSSLVMQLSALGLTLLCLLAAAWVVWYLRRVRVAV